MFFVAGRTTSGGLTAVDLSLGALLLTDSFVCKTRGSGCGRYTAGAAFAGDPFVGLDFIFCIICLAALVFCDYKVSEGRTTALIFSCFVKFAAALPACSLSEYVPIRTAYHWRASASRPEKKLGA